ncbi:polysaccharide deacetylase, partial [Xanthomonas oryzae pv. oryzae]
QFAEALKLRADFALAANNLGFVYFRQGRSAESARRLETTLKIDPSRAVAYLNLGDAYAEGGDREKARKAYSTYLELQPQVSGAAQARAQLQSL